ncbi:MAG: tetratricopeptide (TPR) repeat protein [Myxococcota bacterium]|jgi:tetratricopeptide (TPR) repeat protein
MRAIEHLILRGWLRLGAPRLVSHPDAPLDELLPDALSRLAPAYGGEAVLSDALSGALRRAAAVALAETNAYSDPMALFHAQEALLAASEPFNALVAGTEPVNLKRALSMTLNSVEAITGMGDPLVDDTLRVFGREVREVLPRDGPLAYEPVIALLIDWIPRLPPAIRSAAERDQGSAHSMLGHRDQARQLFEEAGDQARVLLEEADGALEERQWELGGILAGLCAEAAEMTHDHALAAAAWRRRSSAAEQQGDYRSAEVYLRSSYQAAKRARDIRAETVALEELSRLAADQQRLDDAVALLGLVWRLQRAEKNAAGQGRALRLAGRLLAESGSPGPGLVMLLEALELAEVYDPHSAHGLKQYIVGFQYTLNDQEFASIEPLFELPREPQIWQTFAAARCRAPDVVG